jgi:Kef-type K+ transport system membrane component KefB
MHETPAMLVQVALAIVIATALAYLAKLLRQPVILGYIAAGVIAGPAQGFGWLAPEAIEPISELGLILLLFMIGLEIDLKKLKQAGRTVITVGALQFPLGVTLGLLILPLLGLPGTGRFAIAYYAVAAALSSTMIVVKLLHDKGELDTLPGRITLGTLVFQDIWAILFLALQPNLEDPRPLLLLASLAKGAALIGFALLMSRALLPVLFRFVAKVPELLLIGALAWCFLVALIAEELGLSLEMGALIAGVALSTFPYNLDVIAKIISLRDFFITLFFVALGTRVTAPTPALVLAAVLGAAFVLASRVLTVSPILYAMRRGNRVSAIPAMNLSQVSEFSLVIGALGVGLGHIGQTELGVIVYMMILTAVGSTYLIQYNHEVFMALNPLLERLGLVERLESGLRTSTGTHAIPVKPLVLVGFWRHASSLLHELLTRDGAVQHLIRVIDFNPDVKDELDRRKIANVYGDVSQPATLEHAEVGDAQVLVCTIPDSVLKGTTNLRLLRQLRTLAPAARIIVTAERLDEARELYREGAAFVYVPRLVSAGQLAGVVLHALEADPLSAREDAERDLAARAEVLP